MSESDARTRQLLRETNDRLQRLAVQAGPVTSFQLICECGRCTERIDVPASIYEQARFVRSQLIVKQGHEDGRAPVWTADGVSVVDGGRGGG